MYAKIVETQWMNEWDADAGCARYTPAVSTLENGQSFRHEDSCERPLDCECYVSRMRLVETPTGELVATPEPDQEVLSRYWHGQFLRENKRCRQTGWVLMGVCSYMLLDGILRATGVWG